MAESILWISLAVGVGATLALYWSRPDLRARLRLAIIALGGVAAGLIAARLTRRAPQIPPAPSRDKKPTDQQTAQGSPPRIASGDAPTPRPHERDHVPTPTDNVHRAPDGDVPVRDGDADYISDYIERAKRGGVL